MPNHFDANENNIDTKGEQEANETINFVNLNCFPL